MFLLSCLFLVCVVYGDDNDMEMTELEIKMYPLRKCSAVDVIEWFGDVTVFMHIYHPDELTEYAQAMTIRNAVFKHTPIADIYKYIEENGFIHAKGDEQGSYQRPPLWTLIKQFSEPDVDTVKIFYDPTGDEIQNIKIKTSTSRERKFEFERVNRRFMIKCSMHDIKNALAQCPKLKFVDEVTLDLGNGSMYNRIKYAH